MKKIAVLVSNPCIIDARVIRISEAEVNLGYEVKVFAILKENTKEEEQKNGVFYKRIKWNLSGDVRKVIPKFIKIKKLKGFLVKRAAKFVKYDSFKNTFEEEILKYNPDIIHAHDLITLPLGSTIKDKIGAKLIYDAHELEVYRNPPLPWYEKIWVKYIEKKYGKKADVVITVNESIKLILQNVFKNKKIYVIRNTPVIEKYQGPSLRKKLGFDENKKILLYVGKVSTNRGIDWVIKELDKINENIHFVCVGHRDEKYLEKLKNLAKKYKVQNRVHFLEPVAHQHVVDFIKDADVGICAINPVSKSYFYSLPNKVFEMSMAGLPVIATDLPEIKKFLDEVGNGYYFSYKNPEKIHILVNEIMKNLDQINKKEIMKKSRKYAWENESKKIKKVLDEL
ncbi:glycosyltransferase family 4 protein [Caminibacter pacificus]